MADPRQEWKTRTGVNEFRSRKDDRRPGNTRYEQTPWINKITGKVETSNRPLATTQQQDSGPRPTNVGGPPTESRSRKDDRSPGNTKYEQTPSINKMTGEIQTTKTPLATTQQQTTAPRPKNVGGSPTATVPVGEPPTLARSMSTGLDSYDINWLNGGQQQELQQNGSVYMFGRHWIADPYNPGRLVPGDY